MLEGRSAEPVDDSRPGRAGAWAAPHPLNPLKWVWSIPTRWRWAEKARQPSGV